MDIKKIPNTAWVQLLLAGLLPFLIKGAGYLWQMVNEKVLNRIGINVPLTDADIERIINWILSLIIEQEKRKAPGDMKFAMVLKAVRETATPVMIAQIKKHWGTPENAVQSVFDKYKYRTQPKD